MKKILSVVILLAVVAQVSAKSVEPESPVGVSVVKLGPVVKLYYRGIESGAVKVVIYNEKGGIVYRETMSNTEDFMRPYNFSALRAGTYTIELTDKNGTTYRRIEHKPGETVVAKVTRLNKREQRYVLTVPNRGSQSLVVRIYNENNRLLYSATETVKGDFAKVYNFGRSKGKHIFEITDAEGNTGRYIQQGN